MKKMGILLCSIILASFITACGGESMQSNLKSDIQNNENVTDESSVIGDQNTIFDLSVYKDAVQQCRADIMENSLLLYNMGKYEVSFLEALGSTSDSTVEKAYSWLAEKSDSTQEDVEHLHSKIREEYADITIIPIEGNEATEIDGYIRSMYDGYSSLYDSVTSNAHPSSELTSLINEAIKLINGADDDLGLFLD
jgi:hypothetical protein